MEKRLKEEIKSVRFSQITSSSSGGHNGELIKMAKGLSVISSTTGSLMAKCLEACGST